MNDLASISRARGRAFACSARVTSRHLLATLLVVTGCEQASAIDGLLAAAATSSTTPTTPPAPTELDPIAIDAWVTHHVKDRGAVGASLVVIRDGRVVVARGYGVTAIEGGAPVDADTPFAIGSISKQFTCALGFLLADEGVLAMTDPVAKYEPKLARAADITLADLGGHTSGYRDYYPLDYVDRRMFAPIDPDALVAQYATAGVDFEPGTRFSYSNTGYVLLARIFERVTGTPYATLLDTRIFKPLGVKASVVRPPDAATGHVSFLLDPPARAPFEDAGWLLGVGDIWASANALAAWDLALAERKLLSEPAYRAMTTARTVRDGRSTSYGCGLAVRVVNGETVLAHSGWVGGFHAHNAIVPRTRSAVVLLTNDEHVDLGDLHGKLVGLVTADPSVIPAVAGPSAADAAHALIVQLQAGTVDRATLGPDLADYFDEARVRSAASSLGPLGTPKVTLLGRGERGGLEYARLSIAFANGKPIEARMFRSPDGKIRQLLLSR